MGRKYSASLGLFGAIFLAGCYAAPPNDVAAGVGFGSYESYQAAQEARRAQLRGERPPQTIRPPEASSAQPTAVSVTALDAPVSGTAASQPTAVGQIVAPVQTPTTPDPVALRAAAAIDAAEATEANAAQTQPSQSTAPTTVAAAQPTATAVPSNPDISDEQDFEAVSARETIESDAERRTRMQEQLVVVQPTPVPARPTDIGPNVIEYALSTNNPVGTRQYARSPFRQGRHEANCRAFRTPDLAQEAFLAAGGPQRDRQGLDPDGDGYACGWDPRAYRNAAQSARQGG